VRRAQQLEPVPTESRHSVDDTTVTLVEQDLKTRLSTKCFIPAMGTGHEFVYSNQIEKQLTQDRQPTFVANQQPASGSRLVDRAKTHRAAFGGQPTNAKELIQRVQAFMLLYALPTHAEAA
jgi:hypothetical protein